MNKAIEWSASVLVTLVGAYCITYGIRLSRLSGFKFYLVIFLVQGVLFLTAALLFVMLPSHLKHLALAVIFFSVTTSSLWAKQQQRIAKETHPLEWKEWEGTTKNTGWLGRLFLYPNFKKDRWT